MPILFGHDDFMFIPVDNGKINRPGTDRVIIRRMSLDGVAFNPTILTTVFLIRNNISAHRGVLKISEVILSIVSLVCIVKNTNHNNENDQFR